MSRFPERKLKKTLHVGSVAVGGDRPISIQSMTTTKTSDATATIGQILRLQEAGCEIIRLAVPDMAAAQAISTIKESVGIPVVADIHFDYRLALEVISRGIDALRLNPGNITDQEQVRTVVRAAKAKAIPIRIGVNAGSLDGVMLEKHGGHATAEALVESALCHVAILEQLDFHDIKISLKANDVPLTIQAYRLMSERVDYPLHLGVTEAGTPRVGIIKSSVGIGTLLAEGIGDTIRVSLTADPVEEVRVARDILQSLGLRRFTPTLVSCPTCGRCNIDLISLATKVEERLKTITRPMTVAVMGCVVNGPGEAREADIGIAGGKNEGILFRKGKIIAKVPEERLTEALFEEMDRLDKGDIQ
ncbi:MAG: flavodoxin-dependent (E)-4-hydroxy-3-methylbut-2-enyl-diphosphate synthase [Negativicutes bacterium]